MNLLAVRSGSIDRVNRWWRSADSLEQRAGLVLAASIAASKEQIQAAMSQVADVPVDELAKALESLINRPFVERVYEGYRLEDSFRQGLLELGADGEAAILEKSSQYFLEMENDVLLSEVGTEYEWFVRGRIAFYLAAIEPGESLARFIEAFTEPPPDESVDPKSWLADLAIKQEVHLGKSTRIIQFFKAFRDYKLNHWKEASNAFRHIIDTSEEEDLPLAVSEHLWSVINASDDRSTETLRHSIALSVDISAVENEIMARNTLIFQLFDRSEKLEDRMLILEEAKRLAELNHRVSEQWGDDFFIRWTLHALAVATWLYISNGRQDARIVSQHHADQIVTDLFEVVDLFRQEGDLEGAAKAYNNAACLRRDQRNFDEAAEIVERAIRELSWASPPLSAQSFGKTLGSISKMSPSPSQRAKVNKVLNMLNSWLDTYGMAAAYGKSTPS